MSHLTIETWDGQYGQLKWNAITGKFTYEHYKMTDADPAHAAAAKVVLAMHTGQNVNEVFNYTLIDKNGEYASGQVTVQVNGLDSAFVKPAGGIHPVTTEGNIFADRLQDAINNPDGGYVTHYTMKYNGVTYGGNGGMVTINTAYGDVLLDADSGSYTFQDNGKLHYNELGTIAMDVEMQLGHMNGAAFVVDRASGAVAYTLGITGINNAPDAHDSAMVVTPGHTSEAGAYAWTDADDSIGFTVTGSHGGIPGAVSGTDYVIHGDHGDLHLIGTAGTSVTYNYELTTPIAGRMMDTFTLDIKDGGSGVAGQEKTSHADLTVYAVDGAHVQGTSGNDTLSGTSGKANVIWGGAGDDLIDLTGSHQDVLLWKAGDASLTNHATDTVNGFLVGKTDAATIIDLRDMIKDLQGPEETMNDLLTFKVNGGNTTVCVNDKDSGGVSHIVQEIILTGVHLNAADTAHGTYAELEAQIRLLTS